MQLGPACAPVGVWLWILLAPQRHARRWPTSCLRPNLLQRWCGSPQRLATRSQWCGTSSPRRCEAAAYLPAQGPSLPTAARAAAPGLLNAALCLSPLAHPTHPFPPACALRACAARDQHCGQVQQHRRPARAAAGGLWGARAGAQPAAPLPHRWLWQARAHAGCTAGRAGLLSQACMATAAGQCRRAPAPPPETLTRPPATLCRMDVIYDVMRGRIYLIGSVAEPEQPGVLTGGAGTRPRTDPEDGRVGRLRMAAGR